jgi:hypothetical protein
MRRGSFRAILAAAVGCVNLPRRDDEQFDERERRRDSVG